MFDPFTTDLWDPFGATTNLLWDVGRRGGGVGDDPAVLACANVDWRETDRAHIFVAELPGLRPCSLSLAERYKFIIFGHSSLIKLFLYKVESLLLLVFVIKI